MPQIDRLIRQRLQRLPSRHLPVAWRRQHVVVIILFLAVAALTASALPLTSAQASHANAVGPARHMLIGRADLHVDDLPGDAELEVDLSISQTQSDCQMPLRGQLCLRYNILRDDVPVESGYGLIPVGAVKVAGATISLRIDTRHESRLIRTAGAGGLISLTWSVATALPHPAVRATALTVPTVRGSIIGFTIPSTNVTAGVLLYGAA